MNNDLKKYMKIVEGITESTQDYKTFMLDLHDQVMQFAMQHQDSMQAAKLKKLADAIEQLADDGLPPQDLSM